MSDGLREWLCWLFGLPSCDTAALEQAQAEFRTLARQASELEARLTRLSQKSLPLALGHSDAVFAPAADTTAAAHAGTGQFAEVCSALAQLCGTAAREGGYTFYSSLGDLLTELPLLSLGSKNSSIIGIILSAALLEMLLGVGIDLGAQGLVGGPWQALNTVASAAGGVTGGLAGAITAMAVLPRLAPFLAGNFLTRLNAHAFLALVSGVAGQIAGTAGANVSLGYDPLEGLTPEGLTAAALSGTLIELLFGMHSGGVTPTAGSSSVDPLTPGAAAAPSRTDAPAMFTQHPYRELVTHHVLQRAEQQRLELAEEPALAGAPRAVEVRDANSPLSTTDHVSSPSRAAAAHADQMPADGNAGPAGNAGPPLSAHSVHSQNPPVTSHSLVDNSVAGTPPENSHNSEEIQPTLEPPTSRSPEEQNWKLLRTVLNQVDPQYAHLTKHDSSLNSPLVTMAQRLSEGDGDSLSPFLDPTIKKLLERLRDPVVMQNLQDGNLRLDRARIGSLITQRYWAHVEAVWRKLEPVRESRFAVEHARKLFGEQDLIRGFGRRWLDEGLLHRQPGHYLDLVTTDTKFALAGTSPLSPKDDGSAQESSNTNSAPRVDEPEKLLPVLHEGTVVSYEETEPLREFVRHHLRKQSSSEWIAAQLGITAEKLLRLQRSGHLPAPELTPAQISSVLHFWAEHPIMDCVAAAERCSLADSSVIQLRERLTKEIALIHPHNQAEELELLADRHFVSPDTLADIYEKVPMSTRIIVLQSMRTFDSSEIQKICNLSDFYFHKTKRATLKDIRESRLQAIDRYQISEFTLDHFERSQKERRTFERKVIIEANTCDTKYRTVRSEIINTLKNVFPEDLHKSYRRIAEDFGVSQSEVQAADHAFRWKFHVIRLCHEGCANPNEIAAQLNKERNDIKPLIRLFFDAQELVSKKVIKWTELASDLDSTALVLRNIIADYRPLPAQLAPPHTAATMLQKLHEGTPQDDLEAQPLVDYLTQEVNQAASLAKIAAQLGIAEDALHQAQVDGFLPAYPLDAASKSLLLNALAQGAHLPTFAREEQIDLASALQLQTDIYRDLAHLWDAKKGLEELRAKYKTHYSILRDINSHLDNKARTLILGSERYDSREIEQVTGIDREAVKHVLRTNRKAIDNRNYRTHKDQVLDKLSPRQLRHIKRTFHEYPPYKANVLRFLGAERNTVDIAHNTGLTISIVKTIQGELQAHLLTIPNLSLTAITDWKKEVARAYGTTHGVIESAFLSENFDLVRGVLVGLAQRRNGSSIAKLLGISTFFVQTQRRYLRHLLQKIPTDSTAKELLEYHARIASIYGVDTTVIARLHDIHLEHVAQQPITFSGRSEPVSTAPYAPSYGPHLPIVPFGSGQAFAMLRLLSTARPQDAVAARPLVRSVRAQLAVGLNNHAIARNLGLEIAELEQAQSKGSLPAPLLFQEEHHRVLTCLAKGNQLHEIIDIRGSSALELRTELFLELSQRPIEGDRKRIDQLAAAFHTNAETLQAIDSRLTRNQRILILTAERVPKFEIAQICGTTEPTIRHVLSRYFSPKRTETMAAKDDGALTELQITSLQSQRWKSQRSRAKNY